LEDIPKYFYALFHHVVAVEVVAGVHTSVACSQEELSNSTNPSEEFSSY
jgi:hypothetical protein